MEARSLWLQALEGCEQVGGSNHSYAQGCRIRLRKLDEQIAGIEGAESDNCKSKSKDSPSGTLEPSS